MTGIIRTFLIAFFIFSTSIIALAQFDADNQNSGKREEPLPQNIKETLAKQRIEEEKKEFKQLLEKSDKAVKISEELKKSFAKNNKLTPKDKDNLKDLEKLLKKIRKDLGGDVDNDENDKPVSTATAINVLADTTENLFQEIKKTSRYSISAVAIKSSNTVLNLIKFLRFSK